MKNKTFILIAISLLIGGYPFQTNAQKKSNQEIAQGLVNRINNLVEQSLTTEQKEKINAKVLSYQQISKNVKTENKIETQKGYYKEIVSFAKGLFTEEQKQILEQKKNSISQQIIKSNKKQ